MKSKLKNFIIFLLVASPSTLFADPSYFYCEQSHGYAYLGDSLIQVLKTCGNPIQDTQKTIYPLKEQNVDQWVYHYQPNSAFSTGSLVSKKNALVINFINQKVSRILVEGRFVPQTNYCNPQVAIKQGDSMQTIYQLCFWPNLKQEVIQKTVGQSKHQVILTYESTANGSPQNLIFEDSVLVRIE